MIQNGQASLEKSPLDELYGGSPYAFGFSPSGRLETYDDIFKAAALPARETFIGASAVYFNVTTSKREKPLDIGHQIAPDLLDEPEGVSNNLMFAHNRILGRHQILAVSEGLEIIDNRVLTNVREQLHRDDERLIGGLAVFQAGQSEYTTGLFFLRSMAQQMRSVSDNFVLDARNHYRAGAAEITAVAKVIPSDSKEMFMGHIGSSITRILATYSPLYDEIRKTISPVKANIGFPAHERQRSTA